VIHFAARRSVQLVALLITTLPVLATPQFPSNAPGAIKLEQQAAFHIQSGSLESALLQFSRQAAIQVIISVPVAKISVTAIDGRRSARSALSALLSGTGLSYTIVGSTITIRQE